VIGSAIVPTVIAQTFFRPDIEPAVALEVGSPASEIDDAKADDAVGWKARPAAVHEED
jgi:hypothetical protein